MEALDRPALRRGAMRPATGATGAARWRDRTDAVCHITARLAGVFLGVPDQAVRGVRRGGAPVSEARQVAMYLAHIVFQLSLTRMAPAFGRDRTTIAHGIRRVEERRDDPAFDAELDRMEALAESMREALVLVEGGADGPEGAR